MPEGFELPFIDILGTWREKEQEKLNAWRRKGDDEEKPEPRDKGNRDIRLNEPIVPRERKEEPSRDIRRDPEERAGFGRRDRDRDDRFGSRDERGNFGSRDER